MTYATPLAGVEDRRAQAPADLRTMPQRLHRTRRRARQTPPGAVYVGRPTIWANPFDSTRFGHHAAFLLFEDWLTDRMSRRRLIRIGFGDDEIEALARRRIVATDRTLADLHRGWLLYGAFRI